MLALARAKKQAGRDMDLINCWIISRHQYGAEYRNLKGKLGDFFFVGSKFLSALN